MGFLLEVRQASSLVERFGAIIPACQQKSRFSYASRQDLAAHVLATHADPL